MRHWARCRPRTKLWLRVIRSIREDIYPGRDESLPSRTDSSHTISREYLIHVITFLQFIHRACFPYHSTQLIVNAGVYFFTSDWGVFCACPVYLETSCNIRWTSGKIVTINFRKALFANYFDTRCLSVMKNVYVVWQRDSFQSRRYGWLTLHYLCSLLITGMRLISSILDASCRYYFCATRWESGNKSASRSRGRAKIDR